jgi:hypothetical protein
MEFENLVGFYYWAGPTCQRPISVLDCPRWLAGLRATWFPVAGSPRKEPLSADDRPTWAGPLIPTPGRHHKRPSPILLPPLTVRPPPPHCSTQHRLSLHPPSPATDELPLSCLTGPKEAPHHRAPPALRTCLRCQLVKPGNESSLSSSSSASTPSTVASSGCSSTPPTPLRAAKELVLDHFFGRLDHSFGPSPWCRSDH